MMIILNKQKEPTHSVLKEKRHFESLMVLYLSLSLHAVYSKMSLFFIAFAYILFSTISLEIPV